MNSGALLLELHAQMCRIRAFEMAAGDLMEKAAIPGSVHLSVGQEAVAVGVCAALRKDDQITSTHRGHGHMLAKGGEIGPMIAELFGRQCGSCGGKGGSMHISDPSIGALGANGIVGAGPPIAVGAAFSNRFSGTDRVAVAFFGDGASNQGSVHEAGNMAALWKLPVLFVCENNRYAEFMPQAHHQAIEDVAVLASAWGMDAVIVDGMDVMAVYEAARAAVEKARAGGGPTFIEAKTYRFYDHIGFKGLRLRYRPPEEVAAWQARDPIVTVERILAEAKVLTPEAAAAVRKAFEDEVAAAIEAASSAAAPTPDALLRDVYSSGALQ